MSRIDIEAVLNGLSISVKYMALFLGLWFLSVDQWYLPAGLRAASLLLYPFRMWPYLFIGDAAAVMFLRVPQAGSDELTGAILASVSLLPLISIAPAITKLFIPDFSKAGLWQPFILGAMAIWTALWMQTINAIIAPQPAKLDMFLRWSTGYYLGMLVVVPPLLVYLRMRAPSPVVSNFMRDVGLAAVIILGLYLGVKSAPGMEDSLRVALLLVMITPALGLSRVHGWRGAAIGVAMTNVAIGLTIPNLGKLGDHNTATFVAQLVLACAATVLMLSGELFSRHFEALRRLGIAEKKAKLLARGRLNATERQMRDLVMLLAQWQAHTDDSRAAVVRSLRNQGNNAAADDVLREWAMQDELFEANNTAIYPISIESHGLYHALQSPEFSIIVAGGRNIRLWLRGQPKQLSDDVQFTAYRIIGSAMAVLSTADPAGYRIRARVWRLDRFRGIALSIRTINGGTLDATPASSIAEIDIDNRVLARSGAKWRRRGQTVSVLLPDTESTDVYRSAGPINHASPLGL